MSEFTNDIQKIFSNNLKKLLEEKNTTQLELAKHLNVSNTTINNYVKGYNMPRMDKIDGICEFFNVKRSDLIEEQKDEIDLNKIPGIIPIKKLKKIPILGTIACGEPILAVENIDGYFAADPDIVKGDFALRCKGDSMIDANIFDGDIVFFRETPSVDNGSIAAVLIDDETTLKKFIKTENTIILQPCNEKYSPIVLTEDDHKDIRIIGEMVGVYSRRNK